MLTIADLVDLASEHARDWMNIWYLFVFVVMGLLAIIFGLRDALRAHCITLAVAFVIFSFMHWKTIDSYYETFDQILEALTAFGDEADTAIDLVQSLIPAIGREAIFNLYVVFVVLMLLTIAVHIRTVVWQPTTDPATDRAARAR